MPDELTEIADWATGLEETASELMAGDEASAEGASEPPIDLHKLAKAVYKLLKQEARLEKERIGRNSLW